MQHYDKMMQGLLAQYSNNGVVDSVLCPPSGRKNAKNYFAKGNLP